MQSIKGDLHKLSKLSKKKNPKLLLPLKQTVAYSSARKYAVLHDLATGLSVKAVLLNGNVNDTIFRDLCIENQGQEPDSPNRGGASLTNLLA